MPTQSRGHGTRRELKEAMENAPPGQKLAARGRVLDLQGERVEELTGETLKQIPGAKVRGPDVKLTEGLGGRIDYVVAKGGKEVFVESKLTISDLNPRTINQLKNALKKAKAGDTVVLQVARKPTAQELAQLKEVLGDKAFRKLTIVSSQTELFEAVSKALR